MRILVATAPDGQVGVQSEGDPATTIRVLLAAASGLVGQVAAPREEPRIQLVTGGAASAIDAASKAAMRVVK